MRVSTVVLQVFSLINDNFFLFYLFFGFYPLYPESYTYCNYKLNFVSFEPKATGSAKSFFRKYL